MSAPARSAEISPLPAHRQAVGATSSCPDGRAATLSALPGEAARLAGRILAGVGREVLAFAAIGVISTAAYAVLYLVLRSFTGPVAANAASLLVTAVGNTAANRRLTFGVRGRASMIRDQAGGLVAFVVALAITTGAVNLLDGLAPAAGRAVELAVLVVANALATVVRFVLLRTWIAGDRRGATAIGNSHRSLS